MKTVAEATETFKYPIVGLNSSFICFKYLREKYLFLIANQIF